MSIFSKSGLAYRKKALSETACHIISEIETKAMVSVYQEKSRFLFGLIAPFELFEYGDLKDKVRRWDLERRADDGVNLTLRSLLSEIHQIEVEHLSTK